MGRHHTHPLKYQSISYPSSHACESRLVGGFLPASLSVLHSSNSSSILKWDTAQWVVQVGAKLRRFQSFSCTHSFGSDKDKFLDRFTHLLSFIYYVPGIVGHVFREKRQWQSILHVAGRMKLPTQWHHRPTADRVRRWSLPSIWLSLGVKIETCDAQIWIQARTWTCPSTELTLNLKKIRT